MVLAWRRIPHERGMTAIIHTLAGLRARSAALPLVLLLSLALGCAKDLAQELGLTRPEQGGIPYEVDISGAPDDLEDIMLQVSRLAGDDRPVLVTAGLIRRRAEEDIPNLLKVLHSLGYYKAEVGVEVDEGEPPLEVRYTVTPGPRFRLAQVRIVVDAGQEYRAADLPSVEELGLQVGGDFRAEWVPEGQKRLRDALRSQGYPFAEASYEAVADFATNGMHITLTALPGPYARFGDVSIVSVEELDVTEQYLRSRMPWKAGDMFNAGALDQARRNIVDTGLFTSAEFDHPAGLDDDGLLPLKLTVRERPPRTVRAGVTYSTDLGPGIEVGWEHRNLLGEGERLSVSALANFVEQSLTSIYREPFFLFRENQNLIISVRAANEQPEAYSSRSLDVSAVIERYILRRTRIAGGLGLTLLNTDDPLGERDNFALLYVPLLIERDTRDDILDPGRGSLLRADGAPYHEAFGESNSFFKYAVSTQFYWSLVEQKRLVLATRGRFGQIPGSALSSVPTPIRYYAGGGGSVRGYEYKTLSPLIDGDPVGGRSLLETSAELRWRFMENWGLVAFLDGGQAFADPAPDFDGTYHWGTGFGARYYTAFGPVRADIAFPLNRRPDLDSAFQIYVSIGQAF